MNKLILDKIKSDHARNAKYKRPDSSGFTVLSARIKQPLRDHVVTALREADVSPSELVTLALIDYLGVVIEPVGKG